MYRYVILIHELVSIFMMTFNLKREIVLNREAFNYSLSSEFCCC